MRPVGRPFPSTLRTTLKQSYHWGVNLGTGVIIDQGLLWSINAPYSPNSASALDQPLYYDQWASMYNNYMVRGAKIKLHYQNAGGTTVGTSTGSTSNPGTVGYGLLCYASTGAAPDITTGFTSPLSGLQQLADVFRVCSWKNSGSGLYFIPPECPILKRYYSMKKILGRTLDYISDGAQTGAVPTALVVCNPSVAYTNNPAALGLSHALFFEIKYYVEFFNIKVIGAS